MKTKNNVLFIIASICMLSINLLAQPGQPPTGPTNPVSSTSAVLEQNAWYRGGNFAGALGGAKNIFGTFFNSPIYTYTNGTPRAMWTTGAPFSGNRIFGNGDGLRIFNPTGINATGFDGQPVGHLDLWTAGAGTTHIRWDGSGGNPV